MAGRRARPCRTAGEKIRIPGGGRCNFTNRAAPPGRFLSRNPRFALSALSRFTPADFIARVDRAGIAWHETTLGQLFCDGSATRIVAMLTGAMVAAGAELRLGRQIGEVRRGGRFVVATDAGMIAAESLVLANGGKFIPKMGAAGLAYRIAGQFGLGVTETRPALVPLTFAPQELVHLAPLAGVSVPARGAGGRGELVTALGRHLPEKVARMVRGRIGLSGRLADQPNAALDRVDGAVHRWQVTPVGSEGYRTAEVTLSGVDTAALDARTMAAKAVPGLFVVGEAVDVTGCLGAYNSQWARSSGRAAGQVA